MIFQHIYKQKTKKHGKLGENLYLCSEREKRKKHVDEFIKLFSWCYTDYNRVGEGLRGGMYGVKWKKQTETQPKLNRNLTETQPKLYYDFTMTLSRPCIGYGIDTSKLWHCYTEASNNESIWHE